MNPAVIRKACIAGKSRVGVLVRTPVRLVEFATTADTNVETRVVLPEDIPVGKVLGLEPLIERIGRKINDVMDAWNLELGITIKVPCCTGSGAWVLPGYNAEGAVGAVNYSSIRAFVSQRVCSLKIEDKQSVRKSGLHRVNKQDC